MIESMDQPKDQPKDKPKNNRVRRLLWPLGLAAAGLGTAAVYVLRGCWHRHMSWPTSYDGEFAYRTCTDCGIKRLFDPENFREFGPYAYDLEKLVEQARRKREHEVRKAS